MTQLGSSLLSSLGAAFHSFHAYPSSLVSSFKYPILNSNAKTNPVGEFESIPNSNTNTSPAGEFESDLSSRLDGLRQATQINLEWLQQALGVVIYAHSTVLKVIPEHLQLPLNEKEKRSINEYLDDSVNLLDACNVLRESFGDVQRYQMMVQVALHSLMDVRSEEQVKVTRLKNILHECVVAIRRKEEEAGSGRQGNQRSKLENCSSMLRRMGEKLSTSSSSNGDHESSRNTSKNAVVMSVLYGAKTITIFLCGVLSMALLVKTKRLLPTLNLVTHHEQPSWSPSMLKLQHTVKEEIERRRAIKGSAALLQELDNVHVEVKGLYHKLNAGDKALKNCLVDEIRESVSRLRGSAKDMEKKLVPVEHQVDEIYRMLVSSRVSLLGIIE